MNAVAKFSAALCAVLLVVPAVVPAALAVEITVTPASGAMRDVSLDQYRDHLQQLKSLVTSCASPAATCTANSLDNDDRVSGTPTFTAHYQWLRTSLHNAATAKPDDRAAILEDAATRLDTQIAESAAPSADPATDRAFPAERQAADKVLSRPEFVSVTETSWLDRLIAHFFRWLDSLFAGAAKIGHRSPWLAPLIEWGLVGIAGSLMIVWVKRVAARQRLAVATGSSTTQLAREAVTNWLALAQHSAAQNDWRQAIHCLYWASIAALERRRLWAPDKSRTPREYVRLIHAGAARDLLDRQTRGFERIWYGLRPASASDYNAAHQLFDQIERTDRSLEDQTRASEIPARSR